jgi:hypothetical protein
MPTVKDYEEKIARLDAATKIQCLDGNWDWSPYMMGLANGLLLAQSIIKGETPTLLNPPKKWVGKID